jgi:UDP-N-acetylglucosamine 2-epimerase (non-hydrolysing)
MHQHERTGALNCRPAHGVGDVMIHIIIGTKAQLIKMAPVMKALTENGLDYRFISTGQHRETMDDILRNFNLRSPDYVLYDGPDITSIPKMAIWAIRILWRTLSKRTEIFGNGSSGIVLVHGDTFSTLLGAMMGRFAGLKVGHVESGLRSFNLFHPFPEEIIRLLTFRLSHYLFCPGAWAAGNVASCAAQKIDTGENTLRDSLRLAVSVLDASKMEIPEKSFAVITLHRFENICSRSALERVVKIVERIAENNHVLFILHKPTEKNLRKFGLYARLVELKNVELRQRYDYFRFIKLVSMADFVVSDGGSNQEECYYLGKPVLLLRTATERREGLGENCILSGYDLGIVDRFVATWQDSRRPSRAPEHSPSDIIAKYCREFGV